MEFEQIYELIYRIVIDKYRHDNYTRTVEFADMYMKLITGEGLDDLLVQFTKREDAALFQQRKDITKHVIPAVCKNLIDIFNKVPRSNAIQRSISYTGNSNDKKKELLEILAKFWGNKDHNDYLSTRWMELNMVDPNAFIVLEWKPFEENERAQPYPYEVKSANAVDYQYENNILQYLVDKNDDRLTFYGQNQTVVFDEVEDEELLKSLQRFVKEKTYAVAQTETELYLVLSKDKAYLITIPEPHNLEAVPAIRVGYNRDLYTEGTSFVNPFHAAICYLEKTLKINSELDLSSALVAFPQQLRYVRKKCAHEGCFKGRIETENGSMECPTCHGTGLDTTTSVQEVITIEMPETPEDMFPLSNLIDYKTPPIEILQWQEQYVEKLTQKARSVVFNTDIFDKQEVQATATGKNIDLQNVYDVLYPMVVQLGDAWGFIVNGVANITDLDEGLVALFIFQKDFKLKGTETLIADLKAANDSGADPSIINAINNDIARIIYEDNPLEYQKYLLKQVYNPFQGKSNDEIMLLLNGDLTTQYNKVLYSNLGNIFDELEAEQIAKGSDFYMLNKAEQNRLVKEKVDSMILQIEQDKSKNEPVIQFN